MRSFYDRLDEMEKIITHPEFFKNDGRANEVNYWVFDYPAEKELEVRASVKRLVKKNSLGYSSYKLIEYDIYDFVIDALEKEGYLEATYELEKNMGMDIVIESIFDLLEFNEKDNWFIRHVKDNTPDNAVVLLTGVGKIFPILRSHKILNNLSMAFRAVPVILFFPGIYDEQSLQLFGVLKDDNYYRAFRLVK